MRQGLDIADVEQRTKIRAKYLRALENEEWALLPGSTFVKTFLRTYAEVVGLDPHLLVEEYRQAEDPVAEEELQPLASPPPRRGRRVGRRPPSRRPGRGLIAATAVVALLAFLLALGLLGGQDEQDGDGSGDGERAVSTQTETAAEPPRERPAPPPRRAPRGVNVRIAPVEPTYACVDNGPGTDAVEVTLEAPRTFRHPRLVRINLGKRSARIALNGEPVAVPDSSDPLGLALRRGGTTELALGERPCS